MAASEAADAAKPPERGEGGGVFKKLANALGWYEWWRLSVWQGAECCGEWFELPRLMSETDADAWLKEKKQREPPRRISRIWIRVRP